MYDPSSAQVQQISRTVALAQNYVTNLRGSLASYLFEEAFGLVSSELQPGQRANYANMSATIDQLSSAAQTQISNIQAGSTFAVLQNQQEAIGAALDAKENLSQIVSQIQSHGVAFANQYQVDQVLNSLEQYLNISEQ